MQKKIVQFKKMSKYSNNSMLFSNFPTSSSRNSLMSSQRSDGDKLTPSQTYSSTRGPLSLDGRHHHLHNHHLTQHHIDDDDKLLDVVGPPQSPLLSSLQQMQSQAHGELIICN